MHSVTNLDGLGSAADVLAEVAQRLRAEGEPHASVHVNAACRSLRGAVANLARRSPPALAPGIEDGEALITGDGRDTGFLLLPIGGGAGRRTVRSQARADPGVIVPSPDLAWDLISCRAASEFAKDDVAAGLLARALAQTGWTSARRGARWTTSATGANTIVRLLRRGSPFIHLYGGGHLIDDEVLGLIGQVGWHPELGR